MQIDRTPVELTMRGQDARTAPSEGNRREEPLIADSVNLGRQDMLVDLFKMKKIAAAHSVLALSFPGENSSPGARNNVPVVIVHGTMASEKSINHYKDAALQTGHAADLFTYLSIKEGEPLEKSGQIISEHINKTRVEVTRRKLEELKPLKSDVEALKEHLDMDADLYGAHDAEADKVAGLVPGVLSRLEKVLNRDEKELLKGFSGAARDMEKSLAGEIVKTGFAGGDRALCGKAAAEIMDSLAPKVALVGHSMGGFLSYAMALNPAGKKEDAFTYDGGNGIATVITLSSPVGGGVRKPLPAGLEYLSYNMMEKSYLEPMEQTPAMVISQSNPFFSAWYSINKSIMKEMLGQSMMISASMTNPLIYMMKPGYEQIAEGSSFIHKYIENKKIPQGMTVIAASNREDGISEQERSRVDDRQPNAFNLDAEVQITPEDLKNPMATRPSVAHIKMAQYPYEHGDEFRHEIMEKPGEITRLLDRSNYDGIRWRCLSVLQENLAKNPGLFDTPEFKPLLGKIADVAAEKLPFKDSPSYVAAQILKAVNKR